MLHGFSLSLSIVSVLLSYLLWGAPLPAAEQVPWGDAGTFPELVVNLNREREELEARFRSGNPDIKGLSETKKKLEAIRKQTVGTRVTAKLSVLHVVDRVVYLLPDVTRGWPTMTVEEVLKTKDY